MQEKRSLKVSALMLIVAMLITYLVSGFLDSFLGLNGFLSFIAYLAIILLIWQSSIYVYYKNRNRIVDELSSSILYLSSTRPVTSYFYALLKVTGFCGQVYRSFTGGFGRSLLLFPLIVVFVWIIFIIYTPLAVTPINEKLLSETMNNTTKFLYNLQLGANSPVHNATVGSANLPAQGSMSWIKIFGYLTASFLLVVYYYWKSTLALWLLGLFLISAMRSRKLMVIEEFVDNTNDSSEGQAGKDSEDKSDKGNQNKSFCKGLNVLLASRLIYLNDVFRGVNEDRNITTATGVDVSMPATVQVDEISDLLQGAITPESKLELGPFQMPVSILLYPIQRLFKGPRIAGSLHKDGDKTILMAQIIGWDRPQSWRVCDPVCIMDPEHPENRDKHELEDMVYELAYRIFTDITYGDSFSWSQKWKATFKFSEGLSKYRDCLRTDKDKRLNLKKAEKLFIETLAEDLDFTAAYYNLGVVYTELKQQQAAKVAFLKAIDKDTSKKRWEAYYALGQNIFESAKEDLKAIETLQNKIVFRAMPSQYDMAITRLCKHIIRLKNIDNSQSNNLKKAKKELKVIEALQNEMMFGVMPICRYFDIIIRCKKVIKFFEHYNKILDSNGILDCPDSVKDDLKAIEEMQSNILSRAMLINHDYIKEIINKYDEVVRLCKHVIELREHGEIQSDDLDIAKVHDLKGLAEKGRSKCYLLNNSIENPSDIAIRLMKESKNDHQKASIFALTALFFARFSGLNLDRFLHVTSECLLDLSCANNEMAQIKYKGKGDYYEGETADYNEKAERFLRLAITIKPEKANFHYKLGNLFINNPIRNSKNITKGLSEYEIANNIAPDKSKYLIALATARSKNEKWNQEELTYAFNSCKKALYSNLDIDCDSIVKMMRLCISKFDEMNLSSLAFPEEYLYRLAILEDLKGIDKLGKLGNVYQEWILDVLDNLNENNFEGYKCPPFGVFKDLNKCNSEDRTCKPCRDFAWIYAQIVVAISKLYDFEDEDIVLDDRDKIGHHLFRAKDFLEEKFKKNNIYKDNRTWMKADDYFALGCLYNEIKRIGYEFGWNEITETNSKFKEFLTKKLGIDWVEALDIEKPSYDNGKFEISAGKNSLSLELNSKKMEIILNLNENGSHKFIAKIKCIGQNKHIARGFWCSKRDKAFNKAEDLLHDEKEKFEPWRGITSNDESRDYTLYLREYINMEIKIGQFYLKESSKKNNGASTNKTEEAEKAYEHLKKAFNELKGDDEEIRRKRLRVHEACSLKNKNNYKNALIEAQKARILNPLNDFDFTHLGEIYFELDEFKKAKEEWDNALFWSPDEPETYVKIGRSYLESAKICRNKQNNKEIYKESSNDGRIVALNKAEINLQKALVLYEKDKVRERGQTRYILGRTYMELGEYFKAVPHFKIVYKTISESPSGDELVAGLNLGSALLKLRAYNECEEIFEQIISNPVLLDNDRVLEYGYDQIRAPKARAWARLGLAYSHIYRNGNLERALELIKDSDKDLRTLLDINFKTLNEMMNRVLNVEDQLNIQHETPKELKNNEILSKDKLEEKVLEKIKKLNQKILNIDRRLKQHNKQHKPKQGVNEDKEIPNSERKHLDIKSIDRYTKTEKRDLDKIRLELKQTYSKCSSVQADCLGLLLYKYYTLYGGEGTTIYCPIENCVHKTGFCIKPMIDQSICCFERSISLQADPRSYIHLGMACEFKSRQPKEANKSGLIERAADCCRLADELDIKDEYRDLIKDLRKRLGIKDEVSTEKG